MDGVVRIARYSYFIGRRAESCLFGMIKSAFQKWPFCHRGYWVCIIAAALSQKRLVGANIIRGRADFGGTDAAVGIVVAVQ
jgi:hypothetical protein